MTMITARFVVASEAERAVTQLRAAGLPEDAVHVGAHPAGGLDRDDDVGVPDSAASVAGLGGGEADLPEAAITVKVSLDLDRVDADRVTEILNAAGGRVDR